MRSPFRVALLLAGSGFCALVYQTTWLREFRLIFGASTAASAAVLAIFMFGLGAGSMVLGRRADSHSQPLLFYANLEALIAVTTAFTPFLLWLVRQAYVMAGGTPAMGMTLGTIVRLLLAALVIGIPTFLMGGTLPAAARAVELESDVRRNRVAFLYGLNTLGAVTGALASTFLLLETFGNRRTLWIACLLNALIAMIARSMSKRLVASEPQAAEFHASRFEFPPGPHRTLVYGAAALVGFAFLLMELVWYRMLAPLLGGTSFTFGLILAFALLGIGLGGAVYSLIGANRPATVGGFALTCALEALFLGLPLAFGDRLAILAMLLRSLKTFGFDGIVLAWSAVTAFVVIPPAFIAGIQFPLLIGLLGRGREEVGKHVGLAYAWNTAGAVVGSLAGGFGLLPLLTAPGTWRSVTVGLALLGSVAALLARRFGAPRRAVFGTLCVTILTAFLALIPTGPTAVWRHSPIGAGRADNFNFTRNQLRAWKQLQRRGIIWEAEGVESSIGLWSAGSLAFVVNGKMDGNARGDAGTQVMGGLVGAMLHGAPRNAMVIGLGTGSTAGWLGVLPSIERVDVVELEPAVMEVARRCSPVNQKVLQNPKVHIFFGDGREVLLAGRKKYDLIFSEPSNPYRAGIANLYTKEFYQAVSERLNPRGVLVQWLQTYEVDQETVRTIYATVLKVFPNIETYQTLEGDMLLVATAEPLLYDVAALRQRIGTQPWAGALNVAWRADSLEGFLAHFVAGSSFARSMAGDAEINSDDRTVVEFAFARQLGTSASVSVSDLRRAAARRNEHHPERVRGEIDWQAVERERPFVMPEERADVAFPRSAPSSMIISNPVILAMLAEKEADSGSDLAAPLIEALRRIQPIEADVIQARLFLRKGRANDAVTSLERGYLRYRSDPWPLRPIMGRSLRLAEEIAAHQDHTLTVRLFRSLVQPFSVYVLNETRIETLNKLANTVERTRCGPLTLESIRQWEPHVPWNEGLLRQRRDCYRTLKDSRADIAEKDLRDFLEARPADLTIN